MEEACDVGRKLEKQTWGGVSVHLHLRTSSPSSLRALRSRDTPVSMLGRAYLLPRSWILNPISCSRGLGLLGEMADSGVVGKSPKLQKSGQRKTKRELRERENSVLLGAVPEELELRRSGWCPQWKRYTSCLSGLKGRITRWVPK